MRLPLRALAACSLLASVAFGEEKGPTIDNEVGDQLVARQCGGSGCAEGLLEVQNHEHTSFVAWGCELNEATVKQLDMEPRRFWSCCVEHDLCYQSCGIPKSTCETMWQKCARKRCKGKRWCAEILKAFDYAYNKLECQQFDDRRKESCVCSAPGDTAHASRVKFLQAVYTKVGMAEKDPEDILKKWNDKEGLLTLRLVEKYQSTLVKILEHESEEAPQSSTESSNGAATAGKEDL
jgi:hypothetical protein